MLGNQSKLLFTEWTISKQIDGSEKGQCGTRTEANSARSCHEAPVRTSQFLQQPKEQWEQEMSSHHLELDAN